MWWPSFTSSSPSCPPALPLPSPSRVTYPWEQVTTTRPYIDNLLESIAGLGSSAAMSVCLAAGLFMLASRSSFFRLHPLLLLSSPSSIFLHNPCSITTIIGLLNTLTHISLLQVVLNATLSSLFHKSLHSMWSPTHTWPSPDLTGWPDCKPQIQLVQSVR